MKPGLSASEYRALNKRKKPFDPSKHERNERVKVSAQVPDTRQRDYLEDLENLTEFERRIK